MPATINVAVCAAGALVFWSVIGFALSRKLAPAGLALPIAPSLGWAFHSALALPIYGAIGFMPWTVALGSLAALAGAFAFLLCGRAAADRDPRLPLWAYGLAASIAVLPVVALFPKISADAVTLAAPLFDHSKIAMIDEMTRLGLPPGNPFFGETGSPLVYYYLWHFAAAELALVFGASGWEADIALTGFTAFSSLALMMGFATWIGGRASAGLWVLPLAFAASLHPVAEWALGAKAFYDIFLPPTGLAGWLFQTTWAPQHVASASCVLLSCFLLVQLALRPSALALVALALAVVAGYESSLWVGGILFAAASPVIVLILLAGRPPRARTPFLISAMAAAFLAVALAYPFWRDQFLNAAARQTGSPIALLHYPVFNALVSDGLRRILDIPGYWLALLVIEFPAIYIPGLVSLVTGIRSKRMPEPMLQATRAFFGLALTSLLVCGCLTITFAHNNDLGWRAVLPGIFVLTIFAATGLSCWLAAPSPLAACGALLLLALGLPRSFQLVVEYARGAPSESDRAFSTTPALWEAVRRHAAPTERVANNPLFMEKMTPWPINISWALFSNRRSCYAGRDFVSPFTALPPARIAEIDDRFRRVFEGWGNPDDVRAFATRYQCAVVILTPQDGAWDHDPFAGNNAYALAEEKDGQWKIYRAVDTPTQIGAPPRR